MRLLGLLGPGRLLEGAGGVATRGLIGSEHAYGRYEFDPIGFSKLTEALPLPQFRLLETHESGARLRGRTATQRSKNCSEKVLERVLGKGSQKGSERGVCYGFYSRKGF